MALVSDGVLARTGDTIRPTSEAPGWVRRQLLGPNAHAAQHRDGLRLPDGTLVDLAESPLARLAAGSGGMPAFLAPHQVQAGERVRRLIERANLQPRLTMAYDPARTPGSRGAPGDIGDMAADARRALAEIDRALPRDCAGVVFDVCGLLKGLQTVEIERGWPRRSAKLVLRIGLEQVARHLGLRPEARGREEGRLAGWREGPRPPLFPQD
jgi:hypothetical protein